MAVQEGQYRSIEDMTIRIAGAMPICSPAKSDGLVPHKPPKSRDSCAYKLLSLLTEWGRFMPHGWSSKLTDFRILSSGLLIWDGSETGTCCTTATLYTCSAGVEAGG